MTPDDMLDDALGQLEEAFEPHGLGPLVQPRPWTPQDIESLARTMRQAGFVLSRSYRSALQRGACQIPLARHLRIGFSADRAQAVFQHYLQARTEAHADVRNGGAWIVFGTQHGDYEPARVFDRRFVTDGEYEVAWYHQDAVCEVPCGDEEHLPEAYPNYAAWFRAAAMEAAGAVTDAEARAAFQKQQEAMQAWSPPKPLDPARWRDLSWWTPNNLWTYGRWLREGDAGFAADIVARIDREVREGKVEDAKMQRHLVSLQRGAWPYRYPTAADLASRLPDEALRRLLHEILAEAVDLSAATASDSVSAGMRALATGRACDDGLLFRIADEAWARWRPERRSPSDALATAVTWGAGELSAPRVAHVLALAKQLRPSPERSGSKEATADWRRVVDAWRSSGSP